MDSTGNIIIADESALHLLLHCDIAKRAQSLAVFGNPLENCAKPSTALEHINVENTLYGHRPLNLLVDNAADRCRNSIVECRYTKCDLPRGSFFKLRDGVYVTSPELTFARMANRLTETQLIEIGYSLCARYYLDSQDDIQKRSAFQTCAANLRRYLELVPDMRGSVKAMKALRHVKDNSASPMETKTAILFTLPLIAGGFNLPFDRLNYDVKLGRNSSIAEQSSYCVDLASLKFKAAAEFDGKDSHLDSGHDKRRRNALTALGWTVFPFEYDVLSSAAATETCALQIAKHIGYRMQRQKSWDAAYVKLRRELGLPA